MKELSPDINLDDEVRAMAQYLAQKWTPIEGLESLLREIRDAALHESRAWLEAYSPGNFAHDLRDTRAKALVQALGDDDEKFTAEHHDAVCHFLYEVFTLSGEVNKQALELDGGWDYTRRVDRLRARLNSKYPDLAKARPLGWDELAKNYTDFDGQEEYDPRPDVALFEGSRAESACSGHFVYRTALPYVMYDEKCQGRKASAVLVGAVFAQFLSIQEFLNTKRFERDLTAWLQQQPDTMVFSLSSVPDNPHLRVIAKEASAPRTEQEYQEALAQQRKVKAMSEAERAALVAENQARTDEMLKRLFSEVKAEDSAYAKKRDARALRVRQALQAEFGA